MMLSGEDLLAGGSATFDVDVPAAVLRPDSCTDGAAPDQVRLRPLTVGDLQLITRAAKDSDSLTAVLMVQRALVVPELSIAQVNGMHAGLLQFLLQKVNEISGIVTSQTDLERAAEAPLARAAFVLAQEFGWSPQQVSELTLGQVVLNLQLLRERDGAKAHA